MKRLFLSALLLPSLCFGAPFDLLIQQKNIADTATLTRTASLPAQGIYSLVGIDAGTNLPRIFSLSQPFDVQNGQLLVSLRWDQILNAPILSQVATSGDYNDLINKPSGSQVNADWAALSGAAEIMNKPSLSAVATSGAYADLSGKPTIPAAINLTTTGTGGSATFNSSTGALNIPNYAPGTGTVTSVTAGTGLSGGAITTSGTISMPATGTAGTYTNVTTDAQGRVTAGLNASINDSPGRSLVTTTASTGFQISATRNAQVCYEGSFSTTSTIGGPSSASVFLETADTNSTTPGDWTTKAVQTYSNNITLAVVLNQAQGNNWSICRVIPAGKFVRIRSGSITGTASASINANQQEVLQ